MRIRVRHNHWIPRLLKVEGIVLYPFVLFRSGTIPAAILQHEMIHVRQVRARGFFRFYGAYLWQYARGRWRGMDHAGSYLAIDFEREAYRDQGRITLSEAERAELDA